MWSLRAGPPEFLAVEALEFSVVEDRIRAATACQCNRGPKLRAGSPVPSLLERWRRIDQTLFAVVMEAYLHGSSHARSTTWAKALGAEWECDFAGGRERTLATLERMRVERSRRTSCGVFADADEPAREAGRIEAGTASIRRPFR